MVSRADIELLAERAADLIYRAGRVVVFTGAGVSTESGIPDFRSPGGIWSRYDPDDFTIQKFLSSAESRKLHWHMLGREGLMADAQPNPAHLAIAELERMGKLDCVITQNVDNLHQKAGNSPEKVFELHGNLRWAVCLDCRKRYPLTEIVPLIREDTGVPDCPACKGMLKPAAVFFGEALPVRELTEASNRARNCDLMLVIGSTLVVYPAAYIPMYARQAGARLIIINLSATPMDSAADVLIPAKAGEAMGMVMKHLRKKMAGYGS